MKHNIFLLKTSISQWLILVFLLTNLTIKAQYNLVKNGNFESYNYCPTLSNGSLPTYWNIPSNTTYAVYANTCSQNICCGVPYNFGGNSFQLAHSGNGYAGLTIYYSLDDFRYYIQSKLLDTLKSSKCYYVEFYISLANPAKYACNNMSLLFTKTPVYQDTLNNPLSSILANAQVYNYGNPIIIDTLNWVKVSSVFTAQGGEKYITLGNFKSNVQTNSIINANTSSNNEADYYIDDVSVIPLDSMPLKADAGRDTTIYNGDSVFIGSLTNGITNITWYNSSGTIINTVAPGFWVHPTGNTFYVVEQTVCGYTSRDTVNIGVTLPLNFLSYDIVPSLRGTKQSVENIWQTTNEINVSYFNIQGSTNGKDFINIGKLKANNKVLNEYSFIDENANEGMNYYRVESVDRDGRKQYSVIRNVELGIRNGVSVYPNPAKGFVNVVGKGIREVRIINYLGQEIATGTNLRNDAVVINTKNFNKGLYIVQVMMTNGTIKNEKLVIE